MAILLDTNILLRLAQKHHPQSARAKHATEVLNFRDETLLIAHQSVVEFWSVATRPANVNGLGIATEKVTSELDRMKRLAKSCRSSQFMRNGNVWSSDTASPARTCMTRGS